MKKNNRIISVTMCLLLCLSMLLGGCANNVTLSGDSVGLSEVNASSGSTLTLIDGNSNTTDYYFNLPLAIGFTESKKLANAEMADELNNFISRVAGKTLLKANDVAGDKMICIGETMALAEEPAVLANFNSLGKGGFLVQVVGNNLYLAGTDIEAEWRAVAYLTTNYMNYNPETDLEYPAAGSIPTITVPSNLCYVYKGDTVKNTLDYTSPATSPFVSASCGDSGYDKIFTDTYAIYAYSSTSDRIDDDIINHVTGTDTTTCYSDPAVRSDALALCQSLISRKTTYLYYASTNVCQCDDCKAAEAKYGCENAAYWTLVNEIAAAIGTRNTLKVLAYRYTDEVPNFNIASNVHVYLSNRSLSSSHAINDTSCKENYEWSKVVSAWTAKSTNVEIIDFCSDYNYYPCTFPNLGIIRQNMKFYASAGVECVSMEWNKNAVDRELGDVREIIFDFLAKDPSMSVTNYNKIVKYAFIDYYGSAGNYIYQWYTLFEKNAIKDFDIYTTPDVLLPIASYVDEDGVTQYDTTLISQGYVLWQQAHPFAGDTLAKNRSNIAKMLCTNYDNSDAAHSMHQFSRWISWNIPSYDGTRVLSPFVDAYYNK